MQRYTLISILKGDALRISLGTKLTLAFIVFAVALSGLAIGISYRIVDNMNNEHYMSKADEIAATEAVIVNAQDIAKLREAFVAIYDATENRVMSDDWGTPEFNAYVGNFSKLEQMPEYQRLLAQLRELQGSNDVDCMYLSMVDPQNEFFLYLLDAAEEDPCPIGCIDTLYYFNRRVLDDPTAGFPAYITDTEEYGWLVTSGAPVYAPDGTVLCYACVDISMDAIRQQEANYLTGLAVGLVGFTAILSIVAIIAVRHLIVSPINTLSDAATRYCSPNEDERGSFQDLQIHTRDEIQNLHQSMVRMEHDIDTYINNLMQTQEKLRDTRLEADMMNDLAHRDALTGIRNKLAYEQEMLRLEHDRTMGETRFGIAVIDLNDLKVINDRYGHDCGDVSLRTLSNLICMVFTHSPVFRIGGDEFVVILKNNDYDKVDELVVEFQRQSEELNHADGLEPWERVEAAIGYVRYDPSLDSDVAATFHRADKVMYENKRQMKGGVVPR